MVKILRYFKFKSINCGFSHRTKRGFSLVEILVVLGLFFLIVFMGLPLLRGSFIQNDLEDSSLLIVSSIRQAQNYARNGLDDSVWGVMVNNSNVTVFKGTTYAVRDPSYDSGITLSSNLSISGLSEITFSKLEGLPSVTGNIIITNLNNKTVTININGKGTLSY